MIRNKKILILALLLFVLLLIPTIANAAETFTTTDGIVATKVVQSTDGTIDFKFTNITGLTSEGNYTWGISKTQDETKVEKWFALVDYVPNKNTAVISLMPSENKILSVLRATDTAYLYIKDNTNNKNLVTGLKVDLTLPALKAFKVTKTSWYGGVASNPAYTVAQDGAYGKSTYEIRNVHYKFVKITTHFTIFIEFTDFGRLQPFPIQSFPFIA